MSSATEGVVAVVLTFRRPRLATALVRHLVDQEGLPPEHVVLVVNGDGGLLDAGLEASIRVVRLAENLGPAGGFGAGMAAALSLPEARWVYLCEDDVGLFELPPHRLRSVVARAEAEDRRAGGGVGAVLAYGSDFDGRNGWATPHEVRGEGLEAVDTGPWGASLLSRRVLEAGVFPDRSFFFAYEDYDYWARVRAAGFRLLVDCDSSRAVQARMTSAGRDDAFAGRRPLDPDEPWRAYYKARDYFRFARRHGTRRWLLWHLAWSARRLQIARSWAERAAILRGLVDGLRGRSGRNPRYVRTIGELAE
ncbi:MAG: glycosyltransferase family 2 protein [Acidimicrobiales bacterium]